MEQSTKFGFNLPSRDSDDIADINQISENFRIIDDNVPSKEDLKNIKIDIDQTYNPESENAQSGKAVAEALKNIDVSDVDLSGKMDKFGEVGINSVILDKDIRGIYFTGPSGSTVGGLYFDSATNKLVFSSYSLKLTSANPIEAERGFDFKGTYTCSNLRKPNFDSDAATKGYVDTAIGDIETALDSIIAIQDSILGGGA